MTSQKDLIVSLKNETFLNIGILSKLQPMSSELSRLVLKDNYLEKPTQNLFYHLSQYLVGIIDPQACATLSWPLYDTKSERAYKNDFSKFISDYSAKGLLTPVMSSYLVNPGCFKVTLLMLQLSQMAVHKVLTTKMNDNQRKIYNKVAGKYKSTEKEDFLDCVEKETEMRLSKLSNYLIKRKLMENIAEKLRNKITDMENKLLKLNTQKYLNDLVDGFLQNHELDEVTKTEILKIKDIKKQSKFFDTWLTDLDLKIEHMESKWNEKMSPFIQLCQKTQTDTELLISRHTGAADPSTYMIEYNHKTDDINTTELQQLVNSEQKYILKNIVKDEKLIFPNLIRGFLIAISFILKNTEVGDEVYKFNEYLRGGKRSYGQIVEDMRQLVTRVIEAEAKLEPSPPSYHQSILLKDVPEIPPLPDLSDLRSTKDQQVLFDTFTPLNMTKHQFNLRRKTSLSFAKPQPKSLITPFYQAPREDFMKSLISCRVSSYDPHNMTENFSNMSMISNINRNETINDYSSGFTKQQILRLLSTKKSSGSKKFKKMERPNVNVKKGGLFNETVYSTNSPNECPALFRSHSSPNLYESKEKYNKAACRQLSVMQEDIGSILEVSGITAIEKDSFNTPNLHKECMNTPDMPNERISTPNTEQLNINTALPIMAVTPDSDINFHEKLKDFHIDLDRDVLKTNPKEDIKVETPKNQATLIKKTNSLEKIINRFKKVRASVLPDRSIEANEFRTIAEEKENMNSTNFTANRILLPDLLSPSCSVLTKSSEYDVFLEEKEEVKRKPRESLGTMLGVDHTFLDQFDLID